VVQLPVAGSCLKKLIHKKLNQLEPLKKTEGVGKSQHSLAPVIDIGNFPINIDDFLQEAEMLSKSNEPIRHSEILALLTGKITRVNFRAAANLSDPDEKLKKNHLLIICIENILKKANENRLGICKSNDFIYLYNGAYWKKLDIEKMQTFLGDAAQKMGLSKFQAKYYMFKQDLHKQFMCGAVMDLPERQPGRVLINLLNGTYEISPERRELRPHMQEDFITYQLPFGYDPEASAPLFQSYLNRVQPDIARQCILAEYLGYLFIQASTLKLEKALLLYGTGANGKSVFFEIVNALLGDENVSTYTLQMLTDIERGGPYRARIADKLVNYASEINGKLETSMFKAMVSGEPLEAKALYSQPHQITNYAKLVFNCNELPKDTEQTHAFFRRFLIVPFDVTIPEDEQDSELPQRIIKTELSGVFNWVMEGLERLLQQKAFTNSEAVRVQLETYKKQSDSMQMFIEDEGFKKSTDFMPLKEFYENYRGYCRDSGYHPISKRTLSDRLKNKGYIAERKSAGMVVFIGKVPSQLSDELVPDLFSV